MRARAGWNLKKRGLLPAVSQPTVRRIRAVHCPHARTGWSSLPCHLLTFRYLHTTALHPLAATRQAIVQVHRRIQATGQ